MRTTSTWCCSKCWKLYEITTEGHEIDKPPHKGNCPACKGELDRGLRPRITREGGVKK